MSWSPECPVSQTDTARIVLAQGEGGRLSRQLLRDVIRPCLGLSADQSLHDAAVLAQLRGSPVMTTDSFVVSPIFFPGGDIGSLAVYGTVNDLVVSGAEPRWLSLGLILEEGLPLQSLERVLKSIAAAANNTAVEIITGDTKVVPRGAVDGIFINTTGLGELIEPALPGPVAIQPGDELVISGPIGRHGIAILAAREQLGFDPPPASDCAPLMPLINALRVAAIPIRAMRDATRGGLAAVLHEWAAACGSSMDIREENLPVTDDVRGACELLGLDPLFIACEGAMAIAVAAGHGAAAVDALRACRQGERAALIGRVSSRGISPVIIERLPGRRQPLEEPAGMLLPRIC
jgi:hydrogenase expression/formation protein HypE